MDVFTPKANANGAAIVVVVSGGFRSAHESINPLLIRPVVARGYTVFAVVHGSQPQYTVPEIIQDINERRQVHPPPRQGLWDRRRPDRNLRRVGRRPPVPDAGDRR